MKKLLCIALCVVMVMWLCGCKSGNITTDFNKSKADRDGNDYRMSVLYNDGFCLIYRDNNTNVQYIRIGNGVTVMLNPDGTPYTG